MKCELSEGLHSKNLNVLIIGLISGGGGGEGEEGGGGGGRGGEVVIWRLVAGPCGAAMGIAATPSPTKPCSSIAAPAADPLHSPMRPPAAAGPSRPPPASDAPTPPRLSPCNVKFREVPAALSVCRRQASVQSVSASVVGSLEAEPETQRCCRCPETAARRILCLGAVN